MEFKADRQFAKVLDQQDPLKTFRSLFYIPKKENREVIYLCGHSLGLQPVQANKILQEELEKWRDRGVEGHFQGIRPWVDYHQHSKESLGRLVGAKTNEVVSMNSLTVNLHLLLASFYQPTGKRRKIIMENRAFPSDHYAVVSQLTKNKLDPSHLVSIQPHEGLLYTTEEIVKAIEKVGEELALVLLPGVQYYTGQLFDIEAITKAAHSVGAYVGFDLAHAIGNVPMQLHDQDVDFATWCSYKYLNSGPGGMSGIFVHERHSNRPGFPMYTGWWGHQPSTRFKMDNHWDPATGVDAWQLSNVNILSTAVHLAALEIFDQAGIENLRAKSIQLTGWLAFLLKKMADQGKLKIITPEDPESRGSQLSIQIMNEGKDVADQLIDQGIIVDWRTPDMIRVAPAPLYNSFYDIWVFYDRLKSIMSKA